MTKNWPALMAVLLTGFILAVSPGMGTVWAADSGGYGSDEDSGGYGSDEDSGGYGSDEDSSSDGDSGGYGSDEADEDSGGYGSDEDSGGYGSDEADEDSGGYGSDEADDDSGGYGSDEDSGGYGSDEDSSSDGDSGGYGSDEADDDSGGYGSEEAGGDSGGYGSEEDSGGYGSEEDSGGYGAAEETAKAAPAAVKKASAKKAPAKKKGFPSAGLGFLVSSILCGGLLGWVLQRGRFCMNTAFRDTIFIKEFTTFRAYLLALITVIIGVHLLNDVGLLHLQRQPFLPVAQILGGWLFGIGMVLAGGCGSGIWYRVGEGQMASGAAVLGFFIGIGTTVDGLLSPLFRWLKSFSLPIAGKKYAGLWQIFGDGPVVKWGVIAVLAVIIFIAIRGDKPFKLGKQKGFYWSVTGLLVGLVAIFSFYASERWGGFPRGISFTTPTRELFYAVIHGDAMAPSFFPTYLLGGIKVTWGVFFLVAVPIGAYLSARQLKEFAWKAPPAMELLTVFGGGLLMGFSGSLAGGCNMGQGITGVATLSIGSIIATLAIILGNWTMVYFKFIKPMQDMDLD